MESPAITAFARMLGPVVDLGKSRVETLAMLTLGMISARTVNLAHLAPERGASGVKVASTYRRLQRFFQHVRLPLDWAAGAIAGLVGGAGPRILALDRTNWKVGESHVNILVLAALTPSCKVPLMWTVLDSAGNSGAAERMDLLDRYIALFGKDSIQMLLADREFIGERWLNYLIQNDIPFTLRLREGMHATLADDRQTTLARLLTTPGKGRRALATLTGLRAPLHLSAKTPKGREPVILATNRAGHNALTTYRRRWGIEMTFADSKTRGLNFEDTRLTDPAKLHLLTAIIAIALAWANRTAKAVLGRTAPPRKAHGYFAKSYFRTGFDEIRHQLRTNPTRALEPWKFLTKSKIKARVV
jgi:Transposase DDE domain